MAEKEAPQSKTMSENKSKSSTRKSDSGRKQNDKKNSKSKDGEEILVTIDLTDPDDLMKKLDMIDFTDEETEELIAQACEVNKLLKKELQKCEFEAMRRNFTRSVTISASTGERTSGLLKSSLPPVEHNKYSRHGTGVSPASAPTQLGGQQKSAKPKKSASKPEWNDRWHAD